LRGRFLLATIIALCAFLTLAAQATAETSAATTLADMYSPVIALEPQLKPCGLGEAYRPAIVDILLGDPEVVPGRSSVQRDACTWITDGRSSASARSSSAYRCSPAQFSGPCST
jgi:hypothetical protein